MENYKEESLEVQLQLVSATVKVFLKSGSIRRNLFNASFKTVTTTADNPDIRDRAYVYWRLLFSVQLQVAKAVVLSDRPPISVENSQMSEPLLKNGLIDNIATLASVYHLPPAAFLGAARPGVDTLPKREEEEELKTGPTIGKSENLLDFDADDSDADQHRFGQPNSSCCCHLRLKSPYLMIF